MTIDPEALDAPFLTGLALALDIPLLRSANEHYQRAAWVTADPALVA